MVKTISGERLEDEGPSRSTKDDRSFASAASEDGCDSTPNKPMGRSLVVTERSFCCWARGRYLILWAAVAESKSLLVSVDL